MNETERYVAYYRMPSIGDTPNGDTLARQRRAIADFLDHPDRILVGEFTEVMTPAFEGETSPAFDLSLECCRNLGAKLICAAPSEKLTSSAQEKAARERIEILLLDSVVPPAGARQQFETDSETVPYLRFRHGRKSLPPLRFGRPGGEIPAGNRAKADQFAAAILPIIDQIREGGATSLTDIASALNTRRIRTARGKRWHPTTVKNILERHR